ncbi:hypothetical protein MSPP1_003171 [Malassezia sp. CBS 17886]|nr:hypothetical protein MSPP1_003171 [Malassezia sp. CBS 17886]
MSVSDPESNPPAFKYIGLGLAVGSGVFIGASFVFKKKGLLSAQRKYQTTAGDSHAYLKSPLWWTGMSVMVLGEILNFVAYAFADAVLVTPMGALSVVICAILSSVVLRERLTLFGKIGCFLCIVGSVVIAVNAPEQKTSGNIREYEHLFIAPGFLTWLGLCVVASLVLVFYFAPRYGKKNMLVYITVCSLIGGLSVSVTSGLGAAIILSIRGTNQFTYWFTYFLLGFIIVTLLVEINYLNKALELFNTAAVTPTYYVLFTAATIVTSVILSQGMRASAVTIVTIVFGFFTICAGISLLQLSKMDPDELQQQGALDRKSSLLLRVTQQTNNPEEKAASAAHVEDPGVDTVRGGMGIVGSLLRAESARRVGSRRRLDADDACMRTALRADDDVERYQLYDRPISFSPDPDRKPSIHFAPGAVLPHGHHGAFRDQHASPDAPDGARPLAPILEKRPARAADDDADVCDQSAVALHPAPPDATPSTHTNLPPIWTDELELAQVASPTGIADDYYRDDDAASLHRRSLRGLRRSNSHDHGLGIFKMRKSSRDRAAPDSAPLPFPFSEVKSLGESARACEDAKEREDARECEDAKEYEDERLLPPYPSSP